MNSHDHKNSKILDYNYITDGIFIGNNQCCKMGIAEVLKKEGVVADISLEEIQVDQPFGIEMYTWIPTPDHNPPNLDQISFGVSVLTKLVSQNKKIYVHCKNGHGRATTLVASYLISKGFTVEEAINLVKEKRPSMHLQDTQKDALLKFSFSLSDK